MKGSFSVPYSYSLSVNATLIYQCYLKTNTQWSVTAGLDAHVQDPLKNWNLS